MNHDQIEKAPALKRLVNQVETGNCILFLGAGVHAPPPESSPYTYPEEQRPPLGGALAQRLAEKCNFCQKFPDESPCDIQRVSLCFEYTHGLGRKGLVDSLQEHLVTEKKPSPAIEMLARLPFKIIVTTNYDRLFERALYDLDKDPEIFVYDPDSEKPTPDMLDDPTPEQPLLFKIHGDLKHPESIVITDEDYITFVQRMSDKKEAGIHPVPQTVRFRMQRWPTLFVGYSLHDYNLRLLFRTLRWKVDRARVPPMFSVDREPDPLILQVWQNERHFITFVTHDLWVFVPWLYKEVHGEDYPA
jgi:hypothetical protein